MMIHAKGPQSRYYRQAFVADRFLYRNLGAEGYKRNQEERVDYYRDLIKLARERKA